MQQVTLRPYAFWLGSIPVLIFWVGCIVGLVFANQGLKQLREGSKVESGERLGKISALFGGIGVLIGIVIGPQILFAFLYFALGGHDLPQPPVK